MVLTRPMKGAGPEYYSFGETEIKFLNAYGSGPNFDYHKNKIASSLTLVPVQGVAPGSCVCPESPKPFGQGEGTFTYVLLKLSKQLKHTKVIHAPPLNLY